MDRILVTNADGTTVFYTNRFRARGYTIPPERVAATRIVIRRYLVFGHVLIILLLVATLFVPRRAMLCFLFVLLPAFWLGKRAWLRHLTHALPPTAKITRRV